MENSFLLVFLLLLCAGSSHCPCPDAVSREAGGDFPIVFHWPGSGLSNAPCILSQWTSVGFFFFLVIFTPYMVILLLSSIASRIQNRPEGPRS